VGDCHRRGGRRLRGASGLACRKCHGLVRSDFGFPGDPGRPVRTGIGLWPTYVQQFVHSTPRRATGLTSASDGRVHDCSPSAR
jgi:hypothetical protein